VTGRPFASPKDPYAACPCGSGKKFKFCCRVPPPPAPAPDLPPWEGFAACFSPNAKREGERLVAKGCVGDVDGDGKILRGTLRADQTYHMMAQRLPGQYLFGCSCRYFSPKREPCCHVWAMLRASGRLPPPPPPSWKDLLREAASEAGTHSPHPPPPQNQLVVWIDLESALRGGELTLFAGARRILKSGELGMIHARHIGRNDLESLVDPEDRRAFDILLGLESSVYRADRYESFRIGDSAAQIVLPLLAARGRLHLHRASRPWESRFEPLVWDEGAPWSFRLFLEPVTGGWSLSGAFAREGSSDRSEAPQPDLVLSAGFLVANGKLSPVRGGVDRIKPFRIQKEIFIPAAEVEEFRRSYYGLPDPPDLDWPEPLRPALETPAPRPSIRISSGESKELLAEFDFDYGAGAGVAPDDPRPRILSEDGKRLIARNFDAEADARRFLGRLGFKAPWRFEEDTRLRLASAKLPSAVRKLLEAEWEVQAEHVAYRRASGFRFGVQTGIDWFDIHGGIEFGENRIVPFPRLLEALRKRETFVDLGDGSMGVIPNGWLQRARLLLDAGEAVDGEDSLRYRKSQAMLLDALLAAEPQSSTCDEAFERLRDRLAAFEGVKPEREPAGFAGLLRPYQREGLGWMRLLGELGFGGCLADDMGLGKTVQVLALLEGRREAEAGPSLVVVPRSLVFNWKAEALRFAPKLRVADQTGAGRSWDAERLRQADVVLATYGTLRRDAPQLKDFEFDYAILDESQAIKNAASATAKAARLIRARRRLALSGTPIENHLGELWSLFDFLNPGMLGRAGVFASCLDAGTDDDARRLLARALRPFLLRRTKRQVAAELPDKVEQTLTCDLEPPQRKRYDELREHYRAALLGTLDEASLRRSRFQALEALLRLRQAALHPGLIDPKLRGEPSVKLEVLLEHVREVLSEGHKALVFSQFTSMLSIVKDRLDAEKIPYEYLDGQTRDRAGVVDRFQSASEPRLFLISLKAGGQGLNLTAAEYVFLLDPWWNPAVEAQAVDRTHRIGQTRQVFTYRLVARDTVEEKVLQLQQSKRSLADAILGGGDKGLLGDLTREDLELLLS
jgi:superfamily II DNA or RNA helicase